MARLRITRSAQRQLNALSDTFAAAMREQLDDLAHDPQSGEPLRGRLRGTWKLTVGSHRVFYTIERDAVVVRSISHRAVAYRSRSGERRR